MIVVDTSALVAVLLDEPDAEACASILQTEEECLISAGTLAEAMIVAEHRGASAELMTMLDGLALEVVPVTTATARAVAAVYRRFGKGFHPAALNFGDCFAYALARERACPLLFVGNDFSRTDITPAISL
ncbi:MAG: type II toxin-antitoxin system VapC family toxin [Phreatobacter sp.]|nr:type II toxin-antitoxin system VapC family toxin [Phreatobacter sp.]